MTGKIALTTKGQVESTLSAYQPSNAERDLITQVRLAYQDGEDNLNNPYKEFNGRSFIERMNEDQKAWLSWTPDPYEGDDDWRWNGVRPITRNRVISTMAHLTARLLIPMISAQNKDQEEDRQAGYVMKEMVEHNIRNSNYETAFLFGVMSGLVNPVSYFQVDYCKSYQDMWVDGKKEEVIDDVFSGIQHSLIPTDEMFFENPHQYEWQKQDWTMHHKLISYGEAEAKWGEYSNFKHVQPGKKVIMHEDGVFYDVEDENDTMVEYVCYKNRRKDLEVVFLGGVYIGDPNPEYNPFVHRTPKNKPKYNVVKYGYEPIDGMRFVGYKSLVAKMANDQAAADREWQMYFDASTLATFNPTVSVGAGKIDRSVMTPAMNTDLPPGSTFTPVQVANPAVARNALAEAERSANESSQDPQTIGMQQGPQKTKGESVILQQNAQTLIGLPAKMIGVMVKEIGGLLTDDIIRYQTIGEAGKIVGEMTYKSFVVPGRIREGQERAIHIKFTDRFAGKEMSKYDKNKEEFALLEKAGDDKEIFEIDPVKFSEMDFLINIDAEEMLQKNEAFERAFKLETYDRAIMNPLVAQDPEAQLKITRDFLFEPLMKGEAGRYLPSIQKVAQQVIPQEGVVRAPQNGMSSNLVRSVAKQKALI